MITVTFYKRVNPEASKAIWEEQWQGQMAAVPRAGDLIKVSGEQHRIDFVQWNLPGHVELFAY
jgi:hypothetical protein